MLSPFTGVLLNERYYGYEPSSFRESIPLRTTVVPTQNAKSASSSGSSLGSFSLQISLDNTYQVYNGINSVGTTTWLGISRLADLRSYIGARGASMGLIFVAPYGVTYTVIPTGSIDISIFNQDNPSDAGTEFRVSMTLEALS